MADHDLITTHTDAPVDAESAARLQRGGLELRRYAHEGEEFTGWYEAVSRGFLEAAQTSAQVEAAREPLASRRLVGVADPSGPAPAWPVATVASWVADLSIPGAVIPSCAISDVTVAPTHHRRGIARALLEGELRTAASLGVPFASLTVSESTLYGRYGFGPAVSVATIEIDVKRASWAGPAPAGRVDFIARETWRALAPDVFDRIRVHRPGELEMPAGHWDRFAGTRADAEKPERLRAVQYADAAGTVRGLALYTVTENTEDVTRARVEIVSLLADGDDAYAALWRFFVELDLVQIVHAGQQSIDEPVLWMISDRRAATVRLVDHHYVRIIDVPAVLQARRYRRRGRVLLEVTDPLGIAAGRYVLTVDDDGTAVVAPAGARATATVTLEAGIDALSALVLGQVSARTLAAGGRLRTSDAGAVADLFGWEPSARLSYWY
ncbi:GNAT family N-acetyltransferase [Microbacterium sp. SORGH_AS_0888]|uniref:GNAT family N-acetyltransferase n=1 Tax=Microbacterium sp. SORGH_AS_0888 TaxID=3041791 RepID=UPI002783F15D|nr:GNAT family N-acetyltransferase [Microbacterium sp. SORGH_AS_0888]MDQ1128043.1 putative acetyltransferase [Microbacterium sp. SORGH_AS_0888]